MLNTIQSIRPASLALATGLFVLPCGIAFADADDDLERAIQRNDAKGVEQALASGANPNANIWFQHQKYARGKKVQRHPMQVVPFLNNVAMARALLNAGTNVKNGAGSSSLCGAAYRGNPEMVQLLVDHDALVNYKDCWGGVTPLRKAYANGHHKAAKIIKKAGGKER